MKLLNTAVRHIAIVGIFVFPSILAYGQEIVSPPPRHAIKFSPLHLVNPELASFQLAYEYRFARQIGLQLEAGYVFGEKWWGDGWESPRGFKLKQDFRWYFFHKPGMKRLREVHSSFYVAVELHQNRVEFVDGGNAGVYRQSGSGIKGGFIRHAGSGVLFDFNFGFSFAKTNLPPLGIPLNNYELQLDGYRIILPIVGVRFGPWLR